MTTFLFPRVTVCSLEKRMVPVHEPLSKVDAFSRVTIDWEDFPTHPPADSSESE